ncbi:MAG: S-methyl-5-thioribose-1-phosphate isomerase [Planctomycetes bacterium]|nr:S-methyl-5-thioribose-1-phosphate isomerase [Planctomycetota bacterium]
MAFETLEWIGGIDGCLELIDQRILPGRFEKLQCKTVEQVFDAIKTLAVRGAPAIGVAAGYGVCVAMQALPPRSNLTAAAEHLEKNAAYLATSRPTAVNLFWALDRMKDLATRFISENSDVGVDAFLQALLDEAHAICREDKQMCKAIGVNGEKFIKENSGILTHCNAGALATAGQGTALSPMYEAHRLGRKFKVYADETRPLLQGSRLTAWELTQAGIDVTVVCDNVAATLMKQGKVSAVITGADRIAANGDAANKIGTCGVSILAAEFGIPFYVAAPSSTFDLNIKTGDEIPIEERDPAEVTFFGGNNVAPEGVKVYNPAFDVTEAKNITAIITERGVINNPCYQSVFEHLK